MSFSKRELFKRRAGRTRYKLRRQKSGKMRLSVFRSANHIYAQIIDDKKGLTLVSASTLDKSIGAKSTGNIEAAKIVGAAIAKKALDAKIDTVVFDRGGYKYHGRVKALAEAAREAGLNI